VFTSSKEVFLWLSKFINYEKGMPPSRSFRLDRMEILAELAGNPERYVPSVHIAGSKGKGSVTAMIASVLEADGRRAARYMSPHISDFRERICLGNSFFDEDVYCRAADELRNLIDNKLPQKKISLFDPNNDEGEAPTFFELLTLLFFLCAKNGSCDVMVVETGMGGRLDCTNIVNPLVSIITLIELEHTAILGDTIPAVAGEKAGIIKEKKPLVLARQNPQALDVFVKRAAEKNSRLFYFPEIATVENYKMHPAGADFSLVFGGEKINLSIPIPGAVQAENASLAVIALKTAFPDIKNEVIRSGLASVKIPARFEKIAEDPPFIIDGAHTPESALLCAETFCSLYGEDGLLVFGCAADKNAAAMAEILLPRFSKIIITAPGAFKTSNPEKVYEVFSSGKTVFIKDTEKAAKTALDISREKKLPVLCTGSFYLAAEVRNFISTLI